MVKHCGGLPLAIIVLGGILATKDSMDEWKNVHDNIQYFLGSKAGNDDHHALDDILSLSYDDLPPRLKPCFLYMATFSEDESIDAKILYHMWMAEGLVSMEDKRGEDEVMINVAERYLGELVQRCMVQVEALDIPMITRFKSCRLHDTMRDLCIKKARDENFVVCIDDDKQRSIGSNVSRIRRLRMTIDIEKALKSGYDWPLPDGMEKHVRSLQFCIKHANYEHRVVSLIEARLKCYDLIKVLTIDDDDNGDRHFDDDEALPTSTTQSKHLRKLYHLRFLRMTNIVYMKDHLLFGKLEHLQTFDLRHLGKLLGLSKTSINMISRALRNMRELRYLYLPILSPRSFTGYSIDVLRVGGLHKLEVLENFDLSYCNAKDLSELTNLVELSVKVQILSEQLCDDTVDLFDRINNYLSQLKHLSLKIEAYGSTIYMNISKVVPIGPSKFFGVLKVLTLSYLSIEQDFIGILENKVPNLQQLELQNCKGAKEITFHSNGFPRLKFLEMLGLTELEKWNVEEGAMPNLLRLVLHYCTKLEMIPDGLKNVTSLKELEIHLMGRFENRLRQVNDNGEEGADFHKVSHIRSIKIDNRY